MLSSPFVSELYDEEKLIERLKAGDKSACAECIEFHAPQVYRLALRITGNEAEAEDVLQETFLNAFKAIDKFEGRSGLGTWLYRITYNTALMRLRKPAHKTPTVSVEESLAQEEGAIVPRQLFDWCCLPEQDFERDEVKTELNQAITELPDSLKGVFLLRELEGLSTQETAVALDLTPSNVKVRLHRARLWLRERLTPYFTDMANGDLKNEG